MSPMETNSPRFDSNFPPQKRIRLDDAASHSNSSFQFRPLPAEVMMPVRMPVTPISPEPEAESDRESLSLSQRPRAQLASPTRPPQTRRAVPKLFGELQLDQDRLYAALGTTVAPQIRIQQLHGLPHPVLAGISMYLESAAPPVTSPPPPTWQSNVTTTTPAGEYVTRLAEFFGPGDVLRGEDRPPGVMEPEVYDEEEDGDPDEDWQSSRAHAQARWRETSVSTSTSAATGTSSASASASRSSPASTTRKRPRADSAPPTLGTELERRLIAQMDAIVKGKRALTREDCVAAINSMRALKDMMSEQETMGVSDPRNVLFDAPTLHKCFWRLVETPPDELGIGFGHEIIAMQKWARWLLQKWWVV
ncbi:hypothetical protein MKEN_00590600 [Mycena kentingensis (nom. inval.)]|nr:hypothetical protein MKEN_00590600 [Mycena kentingensis (nom. inval.)]